MISSEQIYTFLMKLNSLDNLTIDCSKTYEILVIGHSVEDHIHLNDEER